MWTALHAEQYYSDFLGFLLFMRGRRNAGSWNGHRRLPDLDATTSYDESYVQPFSRFVWFKRTRSTLRPTTTIPPPFSVDRILQQIVLAKVFIVDSPLLIVLLDLRMVS